MKRRHPRFRERVERFFAIDPERPLYTHGPVVRVALVTIIVSSLIAAAGFVFSLVTYSSRLNDIQVSRAESATDTCRTLKRVITEAFKPQSPNGTVVLPAILGKRHTTVTLTRNGRSETFRATSGRTKVRLTVIEPRPKVSQAQVEIRADGLANCTVRGRQQTSLHHRKP